MKKLLIRIVIVIKCKRNNEFINFSLFLKSSSSRGANSLFPWAELVSILFLFNVKKI